MPNEHVLYVYGTLRGGADEVVHIPGVMFDHGWFPAAVDIINTDWPAHYPHQIVAEKRIISDEELSQFDRYEGYDENNPDNSFYKRVRYADGWIYQFNQSTEGLPMVEGGDWLTYIEAKRGK